MNDGHDLVFRIGLVGPSRVGKTSLITALLRDSQKLLQGTPVAMRPVGTATEKRIAQHRRELDGSLLAGEFTPGALRGTEEPFTFSLLLDPACAAPASVWSCSTTPAAGSTPPPARTSATATGRPASGSCSSAACLWCRWTPRC